MPTTTEQYGREIRTRYDENHDRGNDFIGEVSTSHAGNVVLRVGREKSYTDRSWEQIAHVVLTTSEAGELARDLSTRAPDPSAPPPFTPEEVGTLLAAIVHGASKLDGPSLTLLESAEQKLRAMYGLPTGPA